MNNPHQSNYYRIQGVVLGVVGRGPVGDPVRDCVIRHTCSNTTSPIIPIQLLPLFQYNYSN